MRHHYNYTDYKPVFDKSQRFKFDPEAKEGIWQKLMAFQDLALEVTEYMDDLLQYGKYFLSLIA